MFSKVCTYIFLFKCKANIWILKKRKEKYSRSNWKYILKRNHKTIAQSEKLRGERTGKRCLTGSTTATGREVVWKGKKRLKFDEWFNDQLVIFAYFFCFYFFLFLFLFFFISKCWGCGTAAAGSSSWRDKHSEVELIVWVVSLINLWCWQKQR